MLGMASLGVAGQALLRAAPAAGQSAPFGPGTVEAIARSLARKPFNPPDRSLPPAIANLDYDQYRSIRFERSKAFWAGENGRFLGILPFGRAACRERVCMDVCILVGARSL